MIDALAPLASRLSFTALLDQHSRMLKVETALPTLALVPGQLLGSSRCSPIAVAL